MFELSNLYLHIVIVRFIISFPSTDISLPRSRFTLMYGSKKFSLLMEKGTSSNFPLIVQSFSCSLCNQLNRFLRSKNRRNTLKVRTKIKQLPRIHSSVLASVGDCEHFARGRSQLVRTLPMQNCSTKNMWTRGILQRYAGHMKMCRHRHELNPPLEQAFRSNPSQCWPHNLFLSIVMLPDIAGVHTHKNCVGDCHEFNLFV